MNVLVMCHLGAWKSSHFRPLHCILAQNLRHVSLFILFPYKKQRFCFNNLKYWDLYRYNFCVNVIRSPGNLCTLAATFFLVSKSPGLYVMSRSHWSRSVSRCHRVFKMHLHKSSRAQVCLAANSASA